MLKTNASFFNNEFAQTLFCPIWQQTSECPIQRTMLAAVHATAERLIAPRYMIQISAHLAFSYTKPELFCLQSTCRIYWMQLRVNLICIYFLPRKI